MSGGPSCWRTDGSIHSISKQVSKLPTPHLQKGSKQHVNICKHMPTYCANYIMRHNVHNWSEISWNPDANAPARNKLPRFGRAAQSKANQPQKNGWRLAAHIVAVPVAVAVTVAIAASSAPVLLVLQTLGDVCFSSSLLFFYFSFCAPSPLSGVSSPFSCAFSPFSFFFFTFFLFLFFLFFFFSFFCAIFLFLLVNRTTVFTAIKSTTAWHLLSFTLTALLWISQQLDGGSDASFAHARSCYCTDWVDITLNWW